MGTISTWGMIGAALALHSALLDAPTAVAAPLTDKALADAYIECWGHFNARRWEQFTACYGPTSVSISPGQPEARGAAAIVERQAKPFVEAFPDIKGTLRTVLVNGKRVMSIAVVAGAHKGTWKTPAGEIPATGKTIGQLIAHGIESNSRNVAAKEWLMQDGGTLMAQLGLSAAPARAPIANPPAAPPQIVVATGGATEKENLRLAKRFYAGVNGRDKKVLELCAEEIVDYNQTLPRDFAGKAAFAELLSGFWQMSSNIKIDATNMWAAGDYVVVVGAVSGRNDGDMPAFGIKKTGKSFRVDLVEISRWEDGKMKEIWPFYNGVQMAEQLGVMPPKPTAPAAQARPVAHKP